MIIFRGLKFIRIFHFKIGSVVFWYILSLSDVSSNTSSPLLLEKNNLYSVNVPQGQGEEIRHSNVHPTNNNTDAEVKGAHACEFGNKQWRRQQSCTVNCKVSNLITTCQRLICTTCHNFESMAVINHKMSVKQWIGDIYTKWNPLWMKKGLQDTVSIHIYTWLS